MKKSAGSVYKEISFREISEFLTGRKFRMAEVKRREGQKEIVFVKLFPKDLVIIIEPTGENSQDAIRCLLVHNERKEILWRLSPTKRMSNWRINLGQKIEIFERLIELTNKCQCPNCGSDMIPKLITKKPARISLRCADFPHCLERHKIPGSLHKKLAKETEKSRQT